MCPGFQAAGVASGLKKNGEKDLGLIYCESPAIVAGVFTRNLICAAPVQLDRQRVSRGICRAVIANSGNANCCTGQRGMQDAVRMARAAAAGLGIDEKKVLVASTGVIGEPLPVGKIESASADLIKRLCPEGITGFAEAIMTTDTVPKVVSRRGQIENHAFTITGTAKGAGMIRPDMATMLCFVMTDIQASADVLQEMLKTSVEQSFNRITVDGDTSTNDTVLLMASGLSGATVAPGARQEAFQAALDDVLITLAKWLIKDGEGATKLIEIAVTGATSKQDARKIADTVAHSSLVKTALFGEDANWGRILAAVGRAGVPVEPERIDIRFGPVFMVQNGMGCGKAAEARATEILQQPEFDITIDLKQGDAGTSVFTCDFSIDYVKINADYRT
jgi:glutamate N-acetyltransferase/amino-acid N-acetyltransferase